MAKKPKSPQIDLAISKLRELVTDLRKPFIRDPDPLTNKEIVRSVGRQEKGVIGFNRSQMDMYHEVLALLCPGDNKDRPISISEASKWVDDFLFEVGFQKADVEANATAAEQKLRQQMNQEPKEWFIYHPVKLHAAHRMRRLSHFT